MAWTTDLPPSGHDQYFTNLKAKYLTLAHSGATASVGTAGCHGTTNVYSDAVSGTPARLPCDRVFLISSGSINYAIPAFIIA